jgi:hypothetical protein
VFVRVRGVGEGAEQQGAVSERMAEAVFQRLERRVFRVYPR